MTRPTFNDRPPRHGIADDARVLWLDAELIERDGINLERLTATYAEVGIVIVVDPPVDLGNGIIECPGCRTQYSRDRENWKPCDLTTGGWRPLCRVCENTEWADYEYAFSRRSAKYEADPNLRTRPGRGTPSPSWDDSMAGQRRVQFQKKKVAR